MTTTFRPDPSAPSIVAYATWMRTATTQLALYLGYEGPGPTTLDRGAGDGSGRGALDPSCHIQLRLL